MKNTKEKPFITVMILCYNYGIMLEHALSACAKQTFTNFNILLIDNGSTDNTKEVFNSFKKKYPEIPTDYLYVFPNKGPTHGWNEGLKKAKGEYVLFNDADDWMEPDCLELLANKAIETNADRVTGQYQEVLPDGTIQRIRKFPKRSAKLASGMLQGSIFKNSIIKNYNLSFSDTEYYIGYDLYFSLNFYLVQTKSELIHSTIYNYYYNPSSITQKMGKSQNWKHNIDLSSIANIKFTSKILKETNDKQCIKEIYWLLLHDIYSAIPNYFSYLKFKEQKEFYTYLKKNLLFYFPNFYRKNYFFLLNCGFSLKISISILFVYLLDKYNCIYFLNFILHITNKMLKKII